MSFFSAAASLVKNVTTAVTFVPQVLQFGDLKLVTTALVAEGGYSFVYSAREMSATPRQFAVKKVLTQDSETREVAETEVCRPAAVPAAARPCTLRAQQRRSRAPGRSACSSS